MLQEHSRGSCLCGAVQFTAKLPSKWVALHDALSKKSSQS